MASQPQHGYGWFSFTSFIPLTFYVIGINKQYIDGEITDFLKANSAKKIVRVPDVPDYFRARTPVKYSSEWSISRFDPANLGHLSSLYDLNFTWHVKTIREMCQKELLRKLAQRCLAEMNNLTGRKAGS